MDYEKAYKEVLNRAKKELDACGSQDCDAARQIFRFFPELKKLDDERIRKCLICGMNALKEKKIETFATIPIDDAIEWLEKQGTSYTKKDVDDAYLKGVTDTKNKIEKQYEANYQIRKDIASFIFNYEGDIKDRAKWINYLGIKVSFVEALKNKTNRIAINDTDEEIVEAVKDVSILDLVELRFKPGDWVVFNNKHQSIYQVEKVEDGYYILRHTHGGTFRVCILHDEDLRSWNFIQDSKNGDVLATDDGNICIFDGTVEDGKYPFAYCGLTRHGFESYARKLPFTHNNVYPATKEQRDTLFAKMKEAGYEWDAEKKELKNKDARRNLALDGDLMETDCMVVEQKSSWSKEDEACTVILNGLCDLAIAEYDEDSTESPMKSQFIKAKNWLKSLKDRIK